MYHQVPLITKPVQHQSWPARVKSACCKVPHASRSSLQQYARASTANCPVLVHFDSKDQTLALANSNSGERWLLHGDSKCTTEVRDDKAAETSYGFIPAVSTSVRQLVPPWPALNPAVSHLHSGQLLWNEKQNCLLQRMHAFLVQINYIVNQLVDNEWVKIIIPEIV